MIYKNIKEESAEIQRRACQKNIAGLSFSFKDPVEIRDRNKHFHHIRNAAYHNRLPHYLPSINRIKVL